MYMYMYIYISFGVILLALITFAMHGTNDNHPIALIALYGWMWGACYEVSL